MHDAEDQNAARKYRNMMNMMRICGRKALAGVLWALAGACVSLAPVRAEPVSKMRDAELLGALQNVFWISAQAPHDKIFYVIAAPWCSVCKYLYGKLRDMSGFQARFVLTAARTDRDKENIAYAILAHGKKGLDAIYAGRRAPRALGTQAARNFVADVNAASETALMRSLKARLAGGHYGYPVLVFRSKGRLRVFAGAPEDPAQLIAMAEPGAGSPRDEPGVARFLPNPPVAKKSSNQGAALRQGVAVHAAPLEASPKLHVLKRGQTLPVMGETTVDGRKWLVFQVFKQGRPYGYGLAKDFGG
jgi:hypothetical protein